MSTARRFLVALVAGVTLLSLIAVFVQRESSRTSEVATPVRVSADAQPAVTGALPLSALPVADLESTLAESCSTSATKSTNTVGTQEEVESQVAAFNEQKQRLSEQLSVSSSVEHLHLAALLAEDPATRFALLDDAVSRSPSDPFLVWGALQICSESIDAMPCPLRDWERLLISVDGQNSESWIRVAANRYAENDDQAALEAMRHAATAAESRAYWTETIEMVERGLASGSDLTFSERAGMALSVAASELPRYGDYMSMCEKQSSRSVDWAYACLAYGELVESQGKTQIGVAIALSIQKNALESLGEAEQLADVQRRIAAHNQEFQNSDIDHNAQLVRLIFSSPSLFSAYLATIRADGERIALRRITGQIERLIEQQPDLACWQVGVR